MRVARPPRPPAPSATSSSTLFESHCVARTRCMEAPVAPWPQTCRALLSLAFLVSPASAHRTAACFSMVPSSAALQSQPRAWRTSAMALCSVLISMVQQCCTLPCAPRNMAQALLAAGAPRAQLDELDAAGTLLLYRVVAAGDVELAAALLELGANASCTGQVENSP